MAFLAALSLGGEYAEYQSRARHAMKRDHTHVDDDVSQYAPFFFSLRACLLTGGIITIAMLSLRFERGFQRLTLTAIVAPFLASLFAAYVMACLALFFARAVDDHVYDDSSSQGYESLRGGDRTP